MTTADVGASYPHTGRRIRLVATVSGAADVAAHDGTAGGACYAAVSGDATAHHPAACPRPPAGCRATRGTSPRTQTCVSAHPVALSTLWSLSLRRAQRRHSSAAGGGVRDVDEPAGDTPSTDTAGRRAEWGCERRRGRCHARRHCRWRLSPCRARQRHAPTTLPLKLRQLN